MTSTTPQNNNKSHEEIENATKKQKIQVSARVRKLLSWEDPSECIIFEDKALGITDSAKSLVGDTITNFYQFDQIFRDHDQNMDIFNKLCKPLCDITLNKGYNSIMIAYGETGSGKTYTIVGEKQQNVIGVLPMCLQYFLKDERVQKITMQSVEIYGVSSQKIDIFDLMDQHNSTHCKWRDKKIVNNHSQFISIDIDDAQNANDLVDKAWKSSHFAKTGTNPHSSRGHIAFIINIERKDRVISNFVAVDLAGSEGESALTPAFAKTVSSKTLKTRRLEAGIINYGLSQLQKVLQEIKTKNDTLDFKESGLRKVLHPYINKHTYTSVLFTLSPSNTNMQSTRSTLRTANIVSMIEIIPKTNVYQPTKGSIIRNQTEMIAVLKKENEEMKGNKQRLAVMAKELKELKETENTMIKYTEILKNEHKGKMEQMEKEKDSEIEALQAKLEAVAKVEDIALDVENDKEKTTEIDGQPEEKKDCHGDQDKDAKIAELEKRCKELEKEADKNACCACCLVM